MLLIFAIAIGLLLLRPKSAGADVPVTEPAAVIADLSQDPIQGANIASYDSQTLIQQSTRTDNQFGALAGAGTTAAIAGLTTPGTALFAAAGPIGAAVAGAILLFVTLRGTAHLVANSWVQKVQNPFGFALGQIDNPHNAAKAQGTLSLAQAQADLDAVVALWQRYKVEAEDFAMKGADYRKVIDQSYFTLNGPNGLPGFPNGFINKLVEDLTADRDTLANAFNVSTGVTGL